MSATTSTTSQSLPTAGEIYDSLDGFDEAAIERAFGKDIDDLNGRAFLRALIFTIKRRDGLDDTKAKKAALGVKNGDFDAHFSKAEDEIDPDDPDTETGKDDSAPA